MKDVNKTTPISIANGSSVNLTASWPQTGNYTWTGTAGTTRTVSVTPPNNATTNYTVRDAFGCITDNFSVTTSPTLPVSLLTYEAKLFNKKVNITWSTATETNNDHFTIERSANGSDFNSIGIVNGAGNSSDSRSYLFTDVSPLSGTSYYRLSQTNFDARTEYLGVKRIENTSLKGFDVKTLSGYSDKLVLQINTSANGQYHLSVMDMTGRRLKDETLNLGAGTTRKEIELKPGIYIWEITNIKGDAMKQKVVVQ